MEIVVWSFGGPRWCRCCAERSQSTSGGSRRDLQKASSHRVARNGRLCRGTTEWRWPPRPRASSRSPGQPYHSIFFSPSVKMRPRSEKEEPNARTNRDAPVAVCHGLHLQHVIEEFDFDHMPSGSPGHRGTRITWTPTGFTGTRTPGVSPGTRWDPCGEDDCSLYLYRNYFPVSSKIIRGLCGMGLRMT